MGGNFPIVVFGLLALLVIYLDDAGKLAPAVAVAKGTAPPTSPATASSSPAWLTPSAAAPAASGTFALPPGFVLPPGVRPV